jgi:hypothetical protein
MIQNHPTLFGGQRDLCRNIPLSLSPQNGINGANAWAGKDIAGGVFQDSGLALKGSVGLQPIAGRLGNLQRHWAIAGIMYQYSQIERL